MRSYVKIYGPPLCEAIEALEKLSVGMTEVCIMDTFIAQDATVDAYASSDDIRNFFDLKGIVVPVKRCGNIIGKSSMSLGDYDFYFEWFKDPSTEELTELIKKIDAALAPLGCSYTLTTK